MTSFMFSWLCIILIDLILVYLIPFINSSRVIFTQIMYVLFGLYPSTQFIRSVQVMMTSCEGTFMRFFLSIIGSEMRAVSGVSSRPLAPPSATRRPHAAPQKVGASPIRCSSHSAGGAESFHRSHSPFAPQAEHFFKGFFMSGLRFPSFIVSGWGQKASREALQPERIQ